MRNGINMNSIVEELETKLAGIKGKRKAKAITESYLEELTGKKHQFQAARETYHHYHIITDNESGGGSSLFVLFNSAGRVKEISKF